MQKQMIDSTILEIMASRICHDLISPVGAVNNGVEFLEDDMGGDSMGDAVQLISMSAQSAAARLQIFRLAYGTGGRDSSHKPEDVHKTFESFLSGEGKVTQDWDPIALFAGYDRTEGFSKMLICALLLTQEGLPKGGTLRVTRDDGTITITGEGVDAMIRPGIIESLNQTIDIADVDPRLVHALICGVMAAQYGYKIEASAPEAGKITVSFYHLG
jgi:histidine phosphotransferase ChpT